MVQINFYESVLMLPLKALVWAFENTARLFYYCNLQEGNI